MRSVLLLRSSIFFIVMTVFTVIWAILSFLMLWLPFRGRYWFTSRWNVITLWLAKVICGIHYEVKGAHHLATRPGVLAAKHQSAWETIFFVIMMPGYPVSFVLKRELLWLPFFGWALATMRMIPINRKARNAFQTVVNIGRKRFADGQTILIFPEGTRVPPGERGVYKNGASRLAGTLGLPVIPIALNSGECWPKNSFIKYPGKITVSIGPAIETVGKDYPSISKEIEKWIETEMTVMSPERYSHETNQAPTSTLGRR